MSTVKDSVIRIVNGLPPDEPKTVIELSPDECVVQKTDWLTGAELPITAPEGGYFGLGPEWAQYCAEVRAMTAELKATTPAPTSDATGFESEPKPFIRFGMMGNHHIWPRSGEPLGRWLSFWDDGRVVSIAVTA